MPRTTTAETSPRSVADEHEGDACGDAADSTRVPHDVVARANEDSRSEKHARDAADGHRAGSTRRCCWRRDAHLVYAASDRVQRREGSCETRITCRR
jgi:hypothetical protein